MGNPAGVELSSTTLTIHGTIYPLRNVSSVVPATDTTTDNKWRNLGIYAVILCGGFIIIGAAVISSALSEMQQWQDNTQGRLYLAAKGQRTWGVVLILLGVAAGAVSPFLLRKPATSTSTHRLVVTTNAGERQTIIFSSGADLSAFYDRISRALNAAKE